MKILHLFFFMLIACLTVANGQNPANTNPAVIKIVQDYLSENKQPWKLTDADISNWSVSSSYSNESTGTTYIYINQAVNDIRIFNAVSSVTVKNGSVKTFAKRFHADALNKINASKPSITAIEAIQKTASYLELEGLPDPVLKSTDKKLNRTYYNCPALSKEQIRVELVYQPVKNSLVLAWDVNIHLKDNSHWWNVRIDAVSGKFLDKNDWTVHCDFDNGTPGAAHSSHSSATASQSQASAYMLGSYRVYALPLESPSHGPSTLIPDPSNITASPYGWHDTNGAAGAEYTITRGNNVYAYDDISNQNSPGTSPTGGVNLIFDFPANLSQAPSTYLSASVTNLFYVNNMIHDILYLYGFDEEAGNFQENNYGNGGLGADYVEAECQDGGGSNNANFATPDDGSNGRMQMYLWSGSAQSNIVVNSPAPIAGNYSSIPAGFGPPVVTPITANLVLVDDGNGVTSDACDSLLNGPALSGKIAVIDRGSCNFVDKVLLAQNAGAVAVIMINNSPGNMAMGDNGNGGSVTIPSEMITLADGNLIKNAMTGGTVNATLNPPPASVDLDGSFDNGIVIHEYGHGVSNRLTGGPNNSSCLSNGEQGGEGWSDYFGLLLTIQPNDSGEIARGIGTYALGQPTSGYGIRRYPYSTDMTINPETYGFLAQSSQVHDVGEVWCSALWEMTWGLIDQFGHDPDWVNGTSGNNIALKLVIEGMKLQPCNPGFIDGRDAILLADDNLYGGIHKCIIWEAFAKRGMGYNADQGDPDVAGDETENFSLPPLCLIPTSAPTADFNADITTTCFGIINFNDLSTDIPQSWLWDFGDNNTSTLQNPTHTYSAPGTYTVKLVVTNILGTDSLVRSSYISITSPATPAITGDTIVCPNDSTTLTASVSVGNVAEWRNDNDSIIYTGSVFNTPPITANTTYYVTQYAPTTMQNTGALNSSIGAGGYHNTSFEGKLKFTTLAPMRLNSVWVDASGTAPRTINLYDQGNTLIQSINVNIPDGQSRVPVNFEIPSTGDYEIGVTAGSNLFRNSSGAAFPYTINGLVSITSSNSTSNPAAYYYYLYDWEVQELPCTSSPLPVSVSIDTLNTSNFTSSAIGLSVQFNYTSGGNPVSVLWDFGNGDTSTLQNPLYTYSVPGTYTVSLTVLNSNGCPSISSQSLNVTPVGISEQENEFASIYLSGNELQINTNTISEKTQLLIYDPIGKLLISESFTGGTYTRNLNEISSEFILVTILSESSQISKKVVLMK
jgi:PKD repeat protein